MKQTHSRAEVGISHLKGLSTCYSIVCWFISVFLSARHTKFSGRIGEKLTFYLMSTEFTQLNYQIDRGQKNSFGAVTIVSV